MRRCESTPGRGPADDSTVVLVVDVDIDLLEPDLRVRMLAFCASV